MPVDPNLLKAARLGDAEAKFQLGVCYLNGDGVRRNLKLASRWLHEAAEGGFDEARDALVHLEVLAAGDLLKKPLEELEKLAATGHPFALRKLGYRLHSQKHKNQQDWLRIIDVWKRAAEQGDTDSMFNLALILEMDVPAELRNPKSALVWYRKAADAGDSWAMTNLANRYRSGEGVKKNLKKALELTRQAAELGDALAQSNLGTSYATGEGVTQNHKKAIEWFKRSASQKCPAGQYHLGEAYLEGKGVPRNLTKGLRQIRQAAQRGYAKACCRLGICYHHGKGMRQDFRKAVAWYKKAAAAGDPDGMYLLGVSYYEGVGVRSLFPQAAKWLNAAREAGCPKANTPETREMLAVIEGYLNTNGKKPTHGKQS